MLTLHFCQSRVLRLNNESTDPSQQFNLMGPQRNMFHLTLAADFDHFYLIWLLFTDPHVWQWKASLPLRTYTKEYVEFNSTPFYSIQPISSLSVLATVLHLQHQASHICGINSVPYYSKCGYLPWMLFKLFIWPGGIFCSWLRSMCFAQVWGVVKHYINFSMWVSRTDGNS